MSIRDEIFHRWEAAANTAERAALLNEISLAVDSLFPRGRDSVRIPVFKARRHLDCIQVGDLLMPFNPPPGGTELVRLASAVDAALCYEAASRTAQGR